MINFLSDEWCVVSENVVKLSSLHFLVVATLNPKTLYTAHIQTFCLYFQRSSNQGKQCGIEGDRSITVERHVHRDQPLNKHRNTHTDLLSTIFIFIFGFKFKIRIFFFCLNFMYFLNIFSALAIFTSFHKIHLFWELLQCGDWLLGPFIRQGDIMQQ